MRFYMEIKEIKTDTLHFSKYISDEVFLDILIEVFELGYSEAKEFVFRSSASKVGE